ncbi:hypothetical protein EI94DRAFT_1708922 [Lactarius quietus]|nr:hypothetical protein EI94DRAFT_1708922 [Lactarius quietus]
MWLSFLLLTHHISPTVLLSSLCSDLLSPFLTAPFMSSLNVPSWIGSHWNAAPDLCLHHLPLTTLGHLTSHWGEPHLEAFGTGTHTAGPSVIVASPAVLCRQLQSNPDLALACQDGEEESMGKAEVAGLLFVEFGLGAMLKPPWPCTPLYWPVAIVQYSYAPPLLSEDYQATTSYHRCRVGVRWSILILHQACQVGEHEHVGRAGVASLLFVGSLPWGGTLDMYSTVHHAPELMCANPGIKEVQHLAMAQLR